MVAIPSHTTLPETGRPSAYHANADEIDVLVMRCGVNGYSKAQIAACLGISTKTLVQWASQHARFADVLDRAITASQAWWEGRAMDGTATSLIGAPVWAKSVSARFPQDYTERRELTSPDGSMSPHRQLTSEELAEELKRRGLPAPDLD